MKLQGWCSRSFSRRSPADFKEFPLSFPGHLGQLLNRGSPGTLDKQKWTTKIREREANASSARQKARHLHYWNQSDQLATPETAEINRFMAICFAQHFRP